MHTQDRRPQHQHAAGPPSCLRGGSGSDSWQGRPSPRRTPQCSSGWDSPPDRAHVPTTQSPRWHCGVCTGKNRLAQREQVKVTIMALETHGAPGARQGFRSPDTLADTGRDSCGFPASGPGASPSGPPWPVCISPMGQGQWASHQPAPRPGAGVGGIKGRRGCRWLAPRNDSRCFAPSPGCPHGLVWTTWGVLATRP